ncbi:MAG: hypothetical protein FJ388_20680, partial [Verrucomicrobia bacterium]|nr:hypothetical protein [Verrucomicrobiota bacterium]
MGARILRHSLVVLAVLASLAAQAADTLKDSYPIREGGVSRQFDVATDEVVVFGAWREHEVMGIVAQPNAEAARQEAIQLQAATGQETEMVVYEQGVPQNEWTRRVVTKKVLARLAPGADAAAIARSVGAVSRGPVSYAPGRFVFLASEPGQALMLAERLRTVPGVESAEALLARKMAKKLIPNDPYFALQWHLLNTNQSGALSGMDAGVADVWDAYRGMGVTIGIVDDGVEVAHEDLTNNISAALSYDFALDIPDPNPKLTGDNHGTAVAGLAAAQGDNRLGVVGTAYEAALAGLRIDFDPDVEAAAEAHRNDAIHVKNNSWGPPDAVGGIANYFSLLYPLNPGDPLFDALEDGVQNGRGQLGTIFVWAGGNGGASGEDSNTDNYANQRYVIAVGAINHGGAKASYSEPGANLLVAAPGSDYFDWPVSARTNIGMTTTDRTIGG